MKKRKAERLTLAELGERGFISRFLPQLRRSARSFFRVLPGDDAAVLRDQRVLSIDSLQEDTHFRLSWERICRNKGFSLAEALGWKLLGRSLSDLAAMGDVRDRWAMVALASPGRVPVSFLSEFSRGVQQAAAAFNCVVVGGDTSRASRLSISCAVGGVLQGRPVTRTGAEVGDLIGVAGTLGDAMQGLNVFLRGERTRPLFVKRFFYHEPRFRDGTILARQRGVHSMIDTSDSLLESIELLLQSGRHGAVLHVDRIPVSSAYKRMGHDPAMLLAAAEDYALVFTARPNAMRLLERRIGARAIGEVTKEPGLVCLDRGRPARVPGHFHHFH